MTLVVLTMPDSPQQQRAWLERELMGLRLPQLVAELLVVHGPGVPMSLDQVSGLDPADIGQNGLRNISDETLGQLLRQPRLLLDLQESILMEGGPYWDKLLEQQTQLQEIVARGQRHVAALVNRTPVSPSHVVTLPRRETSSRVGIWLALAASIALVLGVGWQLLQEPPAWGWNRPTALAANGTAAEYLNHLADSAQEWFDQRPANAKELSQRLKDMRRGCERLVAAEHPALDQADRDWLLDRCQVWSAKFAEQLAELKSGEKDTEQVRTEADTTVKKLIEALRQRADAAGRIVHFVNTLNTLSKT